MKYNIIGHIYHGTGRKTKCVQNSGNKTPGEGVGDVR
jgi:hypothetical protein